MKIWVIGRGFPTPENRMWGVFEYEQAKLLARNGYEVCYIALTMSFLSRKDPRGLRRFDRDGVHVVACSRLYFPGKLNIHLERYEDECWRRIFDVAERDTGLPDAIHIHYPAMIGSTNEIEKYRQRGVKLYATEHWSRVLNGNLKAHELARLNYYAKHANCIACVGESLMDAVKRLTDAKVPLVIVPNIVSPVFFEAHRKAEDEGFTFLCVGRLVPLKQFDRVIRVFRTAFPEGNVRLEIIGSGPERKALERTVGGDGRIALMGSLKLERVAQEQARAQALVSFSRYETFAAPVAEAWACGKPTIVSAASGIAPYVNADNGIVVPADSTEALGAAMRRLYDGYAGYSHEKIAGFARREFSDEAIFKKLEAMYAG